MELVRLIDSRHMARAGISVLRRGTKGVVAR